MLRSMIQAVICIILCPLLAAQQVGPPVAEQTANSPLPSSYPAIHSSSQTVSIPKDTKVTLRSEQTISSADAKVGDRIHYTLVKDLWVEGRVVAPAGTPVHATITFVRPMDATHDGELKYTLPELDLGKRNRISLKDADPSTELRPIMGPIGWTILYLYIFVGLVPYAFVKSPRGFFQSFKRQQPNGPKTKPQVVQTHEYIVPLNWECDLWVKHSARVRMDKLAVSNQPAKIQ